MKNELPFLRSEAIPIPVLAVFRGIGQVFFQENALTGVFFAIGIALNSPLMALAAIAGSAIGMATAKVLRFDESEVSAGIYGFNSALVGIAVFVFFRLGVASVTLLLVGSVVAAVVTRLMRQYLPFPTYTTPFIVTTWALFLLGQTLGVTAVESGGPPVTASIIEAIAHGIGQVMFQASIWTGLLFLIGIAVNDWHHALWVIVASALGMLVGIYHHDSPAEVALLGLYGYNATLAAIALFLWRPSLIAPVLGILLSVPLIAIGPLLGLPALTAPFVLATWLVLALGWLERKLFPAPSLSVT